jgi:epoxyqueuosine reductase
MLNAGTCNSAPQWSKQPVATAEWNSELDEWLRLEASAAGFDLAGIAPVATSLDGQLTAERFTAWIEAGRAGEMEYLKRRDLEGVLLRSDVQIAIPWARSVILCAFNYNAPAPLSIEPAPDDTGWIARYAWSGSDPESMPGSDPESMPGSESESEPGNESEPRRGIGEQPPRDSAPGKGLLPTDYHDQLLTRLQHLESALQIRQPCQTRCYVDTGPLVERAAAAAAGIGWIGKNTCVLNQQLGSWLLLGVIVTSLPVASTLEIQTAADRCGSCTRCIDACPTAALVAPREMDASRCIAYLTIEKKGSIPEDLRPLMGRQVFGCDICQDVCPWNDKSRNGKSQHGKSEQRRVKREDPEGRNGQPNSASPFAGMLPRAELINPQLEWLAAMDGPTFKRHFKGSPLERTRRKRILRNVAIAMGNSGRQQFLPTLRAWSVPDDDDPILAETARWAIRQLNHTSDQSESPSAPLC